MADAFFGGEVLQGEKKIVFREKKGLDNSAQI